jgi:hypothetical protein
MLEHPAVPPQPAAHALAPARRTDRYFAGLLAVGVYASRFIGSNTDYLMAGRRLGPVLATATLYELGYADAFATISAIGIVVAILSPLYPRLIDLGPDEEDEEDTGLQAAFDHQLHNEAGDQLVSRSDPSSGTKRSWAWPRPAAPTADVRDPGKRAFARRCTPTAPWVRPRA